MARAVVLIVLLGVAAGSAWLAWALGTPYQGFSEGGVFVEIPRGLSSGVIARKLVDHGIVRSRIAFQLLCRWRRAQALQAGEYFFDRPRTATEVFRMLAEGRVYVHSVVVPEGKTIFEIAELMEREGLTTRRAFFEAASDVSLIHDVAPRAKNLEGFLFPATYQFPRRVTAGRIVETMVKRFREVWTKLAATENSRDLSSAEIVTLASLIEKETRLREERPLVASVFRNRLKRGMALQCDPTVIYALELASQYTGSLSSKDLRLKSPYNTYRYPGLPPGPIANPGEAALRAALEKPQAGYLYFVSNLQGGHFFSKTLQEHNQNVSRYRRLQTQNGKIGTPATAPRNPR